MRNLRYIVGLSTICLLLGSCQPPSNAKSKEPAQAAATFPYTLKPDAAFSMPKELEEISGITFDPNKPAVAYAIQDEDGILYSYDLQKKQVIATFGFGKGGDYEDVATDGKFFYVLRSDGRLYSFPFNLTRAQGAVQEFKGLLPKGEYESLAINPLTGSVYVLCKSCPADKKGDALTGYMLRADEQGRLQADSRFSIEMSAVSQLDPSIKKIIKPSAMTRRASSNEWYILSSIDRLLLLTDDEFKPKKVIRFSRKDFEQPEGIAFDQQERLFIGSEAGKQDFGMIYQFNLR